ncbi:hypothetical protein Spla01_02106 [Streptomyces platensis]|uniref:IgA FC receptor n=1 Tax=Streptomyces platensis TaxID=58346 RepID=A0ABX3XP31_STRPT|nr:hypothetical protein BG653_06114 [Streptomyces platensis]
MVTLAVPPTSGAVSVPPPVPLMTKVTVPVGMPEPGGTGATVAVKVTGCPKTDGSGNEVTVVVVGVRTCCTVCVSVPDDALNCALPPYVAVMRWVPGLRLLVVTVAVPPTSGAVSVPPPPPAMTKVTVPVGVPAPGATGATVAVMVTGCPKFEGSGDEVTTVDVDALLIVTDPKPLDGENWGLPL